MHARAHYNVSSTTQAPLPDGSVCGDLLLWPQADGSAPARALVNDRWAENPRLTMLVNSLSSRMRHFAMFEWFYSTIDRDYFNHNEFQDCLDHLELRHITKLTRSAQLTCVHGRMASQSEN